MRVILIPHDDSQTCSEVVVPGDHSATLEKLQMLVGGYIESVHTSHLLALTDRELSHTPVVMLVDEDGHPMQRPVNRRASQFYGDQTDEIVGDVLLAGLRRGPEGDDWVSLPDYFTLSYFNDRTGLR